MILISDFSDYKIFVECTWLVCSLAQLMQIATLWLGLCQAKKLHTSDLLELIVSPLAGLHNIYVYI